MRIKSCPVRIKAAGTHEGTDEGTFEAIVAAYNLDSVGDKIAPGAFAETLAEWKSRGDPIPVLWSHMSHDPEYHIGEVLEAEERPEGLWIKARVDLDEGTKAAQVYKLMKGRRVTQFSFAYDVDEGSWVEQKDGPGYYELRKLKLYEVGPCLIGANQSTELIDVKSALGDTLRVTLNGPALASGDAVRSAVEKAMDDHITRVREAVDAAIDTKAGRTLSAANEERVREIARLSTELLDSVSSSTEDAEKATPAPPESASPQEPAAKAGEARPGTASSRLRTDIEVLCLDASTLTD
ncbi:HK97 family phage prohead protease [Streptomyces sp. NBC_01775]|uniref:HK97 family phage prohead protease n=1 Tax=Streptomyces sp. NBC_01775 TaxID=2975939 RepID=UPI002DD9FFBB|nr:HK97 family phage prohead protease [Streptomyces sp. NBC_01775]WSB74735.1 HK97 family phage prohead protease [Streptomyces sp. NBC_01775]